MMDNDKMNQQPIQPPTPTNSHVYIWIFVIVALVIIAGLWYYLTGSLRSNPKNSATVSSQPSEATITSDADLQTNQDELDSTDLSTIDATLNQNDTDSSQF